MKVTACLISWKRQNNFAKIIPHLLAQPWIDDIIIHDNSKGHNIMNYGRYTASRRARHNVIYTQDDDCIIHGLDKLWEAYDGSQLVYGHQAHMTPEIFGGKHMAIMGWGTIFDRRWTNVLKGYINHFGKDKCFYRETDRIFTMLLNQRHKPVVIEVEHLEGYNDENSLSSQENHIAFKKLAITRCATLDPI